MEASSIINIENNNLGIRGLNPPLDWPKSGAQSIPTIHEYEESARKSLLLKRKELRWKLMVASQTQNRAKLEEIRIEANYNKKRMIKIAALAKRLKAKYIKAARASKVAEALYKKVEEELLTHEKFVADEKMQLTKLAVDCRKIGSLLYGKDYKLSTNSCVNKERDRQRLALRLEAAKAAMRDQMLEFEKKASINSPAKRVLELRKAQANTKIVSQPSTDKEECLKPISTKKLQVSPKKTNAILLRNLAPFLRKKTIQTEPTTSTQIISPSKKHKQPLVSQLSSLYNSTNSVLRNLASYRLTTKFSEIGIPITDLRYTHNICPNDYICLPDLTGVCTDKNCLYQHRANYFMSDIDKLADILSYKPSLTGFKPEPNLSQEENDNRCRLKLKEYAAKLLAKNSGKPVETIAHNLVKYVRATRSDQDLLTQTRELPKFSHQICNTFPKVEGSTEQSEN